MNTIVLGIDTSTAVSVGLACGSEVLVSLHHDYPRAHAEQLMPLIHTACEQAEIALTDIGDVAIGVGPGPYTGLRVGVATGRVLAHLADLTPHPVCSLDVLARQWADDGVDGEFVVCTDARRHELYWARYDASGNRLDGPNVTRPEELARGYSGRRSGMPGSRSDARPRIPRASGRRGARRVLADHARRRTGTALPARSRRHCPDNP
ncbi:universal bacterial protein YeaZ [Propionibacterium sp. KPL1844]|jgi:universal bacterial protein yeaZ|nr:universal bacterial protein YeaZ [Propionibacterium sp. KPL1844]